MVQGRLVVALALAALFGWLSILSFLWSVGRAAPENVAMFGLHEHPKRVMDAATLQFRTDRGELANIDFAALGEAIARSPLEEEPLAFEAGRFKAQGQVAEAERLLRLAVRRNPRSREARLLLLESFALRGNAAEAVTQVEALYRLMPSQREQLQATLLYLASYPGTRIATLEAITEPALKPYLLRELARGGASASMLLDALDRLGDVGAGENHDGFVASLTTPLLDAGDAQGARRVYQRLTGENLGDSALLRDPGFTGEASPPFGWHVFGGPDGYSRLGDGGLAGEYYGRRRPLLARQTVLLQPGSYQLRIASDEVGRGLALQLACKGGERIGEHDIKAAREQIRFTISGACRVLDIAVVGTPFDPPSRTAFRIRDITLERTTS